MRNLKSSRAIYAKGLLFLVIGMAAAGLVVLENPTPKTGLLLAIAVWSFCRFYYFAFYVIEHYLDESYRFSGLWSFARYVLRQRSTGHSASVRAEEVPCSQEDAGPDTRNEGGKV